MPPATGRRVRLALSPGGGDAVAIRFPEKRESFSRSACRARPVPIPATGEPEKAVAALHRAAHATASSSRRCSADARRLTAELFRPDSACLPRARALAAARPRNAIPQYSPDQTITLTRMRL